DFVLRSLHVLVLLVPRPPLSTLFPYTTLFRSRRKPDGTFPDLALAYDFSALSDSDGALRVSGIPTGLLRCRVEGPAFGARYLDVDRKSTRLNSSHVKISYAVFCLKKKKEANPC